MHYLNHLKQDRKLAKILDHPLEALAIKKNIALHLISAIIAQQLSTKVAAVIYQRFLKLTQSSNPTPKKVLKLKIEELRSVGLSQSKAQYILNVASFFVTHQLTDRKIYAMDDETVIALLTQIKGVGRWTVEMILMSCLARPDVFAADDLGIQQSMEKIYAIKYSSKKELKTKMEKIAENWRPYRTYACKHLWMWKDKN